MRLPQKRAKQAQSLPLIKPILILMAINILLIILIVIFKSKLPPQIPLYYGKPRGEGQLARDIELVIPSLISLAIVAINSLIINTTKDQFIQKTLLGVSIVATILSAVTTIQIALLVGNL